MIEAVPLATLRRKLTRQYRYGIAVTAAVLQLTVPAGVAATTHKRVVTAAHARLPSQRSAAIPTALPDTPAVEQLRRAYQFAFPVYEMMRTRAVTLSKARAHGIDGINQLFVRKTLADANTRDVTTPNNDTLYASAWLDLSGGPVRFNTPPLSKRYYSAALMNLFTDNVAVVGTRTVGASRNSAGRYLIAGPAWHGEIPDGVALLRSDTNDAWLLVRVLVDGPGDLDAAVAAAQKFVVDEGTDVAAPTTAVPTPLPDPATLLAVVNEALGRTPLSPALAEHVAGFADQGIKPGATDAFAQLPPVEQALWRSALPALRAELQRSVDSAGTLVDGWRYFDPATGNFGAGDAGRAVVALAGLGALPRAEAVYLTASVDQAGAALDGSKAYTVHLPAQLPVGAFWSLTMYSVELDGRLLLVANPLQRFALGSRSPSLRAERDGSTDIFVQAAMPGGERVVNWLPAPKGKFKLVFRAYLPGLALQDGSLHLPPVMTSELIP